MANVLMEFAFWLLAAVVVFVYFGYPAMLWLLTRGGAPAAAGEIEEWPSVTLLISAYNEEDCIAGKLDNSLALDYPEDRLDIVVISDGSEDRTDEIVQGYADRGVRLLRLEGRGGKTLGLNAGVGESNSDVVVFSDANAMYRPDAIRALVGPLADDATGAVIGEQAYESPDSEAGKSESLYWRYETAIKEFESRKGSVVGGDGAIYAVRRSLFQPMRADALSDFVNPLQVVRSGHRVVYNRSALAYEETAGSYDKEFRRKVRIVNRAWRAAWSMPEMLNPLRHGTFAIKLWSHKVLRWLVPFFLGGLLLLNVALLDRSPVYTVTLLAQGAFYGLAAIGALLRDRPSLPSFLYIPYYFCLVNLASAKGILDAFRGETYTTWSTARSDSSAETATTQQKGS